MTDIQAIVIGIVQGATEWLPVSSTAHLRVVPTLLGWPDPGAAFTAICQWGTVLAAILYFRREILGILTNGKLGGSFAGSEKTDRRLLVPIVVGSIPIGVAGLLGDKLIEGPLRSLWVVAGALILFAGILAIAERRRGPKRSIEEITVADGLKMGLWQSLALIPGASRSGTSITGGLFGGLERSAAARFSFLLSLPAVTAAGLYELKKYAPLIRGEHLGRPLVLATAAAFAVGWASIHWLIGFLRTRPTHLFVVYRVVLGLALFGLLAAHRVPAADPADTHPGTPAAATASR